MSTSAVTDRALPGEARAPHGFAAGVAAIFASALALRVLHVWQLRSAPFFDLKLGDARSYHDWAQAIAAGDWLGSTVFYQAPLYPYFLGSLYALIGDDAMVVRLCQSLLGALSCALIADAGRRLFSPAAGLVAGGLLAIYAPAIFFDGLIQKTSLAAFLLCASLFTISCAMQRPRPSLFFALGTLLGALTLTRENALAIAGIVAFWSLFQAGPRALTRWASLTALLLGLCAVLLPVTLRNWSISGELHLTTSQAGPNFYIGNNRDATGLYMPLGRGRGDPLSEQRDARAIAERAMGTELSPGEVSTFWAGRALKDILQDPAAWVGLMGRKLALTWNAAEIGDTEFQQEHALWSTPLRTAGALLHFGVLAPLAALGLWVTWPERRRLWLFYLLLASYTASVVAFYVFARYRHPLAPVLLLFAGAGLVGARSRLRGLPLPKAAALALSLAGVALFCNWPLAASQPASWVADYNLGSALLASGDLDAAEASFRDALQYEPDRVLVHTQLGITLEARGRPSEAIDEFRRAIAIEADFPDAHIGISRALVALGREPEALAHLRTAAELEPSSPRPLNNAAWLLATRAQLDSRSASRSLRMAKRANQLTRSADATVLDTLAAAYAANAQFEAAVVVAERARESALQGGENEIAAEISARLSLYQRGQRFVRSDPSKQLEAQRPPTEKSKLSEP